MPKSVYSSGARTKSLPICIVLWLLGLLLSGCASRPRTLNVTQRPLREYVTIEEFCRERSLEYSFDTIDDVIRIYSSNIEIKILLNTPLATVQGTAVVLDGIVVYHNGNIIIPPQLGKIIAARPAITFRPLFHIQTIMLDPGHGGKDPGAVSACGFQEKTLNLLVAKAVKTRLQEQGYKVFLTREHDTYLSLSERVKLAKEHNVDLFVSIHANANRLRMVSGVEVYYLNPQRLDSQQRAHNISKIERFPNASVSEDVEEILWDLVFTKNYSFSMELANVLYNSFKELGFSIRPPKTAGFYVLRNAYVPAVLLEIGYLTNMNEEKALRSTHYQKQIAEAVVFSINSLQQRYSGSERKSLAFSP